MKFSVLLPTRNRLDLLRYAVESVRRQDYSDWEIIISDNASEDDIGGFAKSLNDARVKYFRTEKLVPVTDNWNNALDRSTGDYVIMLGDDDCILPGYFNRVRKLAADYDNPDAIYSRGYIYAYPGVIPDRPEGYLHLSGFADFLGTQREPFFIDQKTARRMVDHSLRFQARFEYNMQYTTVSRRCIESLRKYGSFYQSPFPDFYATNALFLKAPRLLASPQPLVIIGISPKSYGFYHFNGKEKAGTAFLQCVPDAEAARRMESVVLPGSMMNTNWLYAMETLKHNFGAEFGFDVDYERYRALQLFNYYAAWYDRKLTREDKEAMQQAMRPDERQRYGRDMFWARLRGRRHAKKMALRSLYKLEQYASGWNIEYIPQKCANILEASAFVAMREK